jgi:hypothetical protein
MWCLIKHRRGGNYREEKMLQVRCCRYKNGVLTDTGSDVARMGYMLKMSVASDDTLQETCQRKCTVVN